MARDIDSLIAQLTLDEKASLTAGADLWSTVAVERLGLPSVRVTDGPNGARGPSLPGHGRGLVHLGLPAVRRRAGRHLGHRPGRAGRAPCWATRPAPRPAGCCWRPTVNLHRSPLGGRNFESYSEDPLLAGRIAAAFVRGAQSQGVATTVKHLAGNESEIERMTANSVIDERTLRELYLLPFELAVREGGSLGIMTSYNRLNGRVRGRQPRAARGHPARRVGVRGLRGHRLVRHGRHRGRRHARASTSRCPARPGSSAHGWPRRWPTAGSTRRWLDAAVTRLLGTLDRIGGARRRARRAASRSTSPSTGPWPARWPPPRMVLLRNDGVLPARRRPTSPRWP